MLNVGKPTADVPNQGWGLFIVSVVMVIVSGLFVSTRIVIRSARRMMGLDDWTIVLVSSATTLAALKAYAFTDIDLTHLPHHHRMLG